MGCRQANNGWLSYGAMMRDAKVTTVGTAKMKRDPNAFSDVMKDMTRMSLARCLETCEHPCKNRPQTAARQSNRSEKTWASSRMAAAQ